MRAQAARALGERAVPIAVEPLVKRLKDGDLPVRLQAVIALGRIGQRRGRSRRCCRSWPSQTHSWLTRPARRFDESATGPPLPGTRFTRPQGAGGNVAGDGTSV